MTEPTRRRRGRAFADSGWIVVGLVWVAAAVLGYVGFVAYFEALGEPQAPTRLVYLTLQLFVLESGSIPGPVPLTLEIARFLAPAIAGGTALAAIAVLFRQQLTLLKLRFLRGHVVICGLGRKGLLLADAFARLGRRVVVLEKEDHNPFADRARDAGAIVLVGDAADPALLADAHVGRADYLIAVCGDEGANAEIAMNARVLARDRKGDPLPCLIHVADLNLYRLLKERELEGSTGGETTLVLFNIYEAAARALLRDHPPGETSHVLVVGMGRLGESLIVQLARSWHDQSSDPDGRLAISVIDRDADAKLDAVARRSPDVLKSCRLRAYQVEASAVATVGDALTEDRSGLVAPGIAYVCLDDDSRALATALDLAHRTRDTRMPIVVRLTHAGGVATLLGDAQAERACGAWPEQREAAVARASTRLHGFAFLDRTCLVDLVTQGVTEVLARALHAEYVRTATAAGVPAAPSESRALVPWGELSDDLKDSNRHQAAELAARLEAIGYEIGPLADADADELTFSDEEIELMARLEHERWIAERRGQGWRYAPGPKDPAARTHPCIVGWNELGQADREKNRAAVRALPHLFADVGLEIYRGIPSSVPAGPVESPA